MIIMSTLSRSWPAHGITIAIGRNEIPDGDATRRALLEHFLGPFLECGQMRIEPEPAAPKGGK
jgi:hypothetical protein